MRTVRKLIRPFIRFIWNIINFFRWPYIDLAVILWPPAYEYFDDIVTDIKDIYPVLDERDFEIEDGSMKKFMLELYAIDRATEKKISLKIDRLLVAPHKLRILKIRIRWPRMKSHCDFNSWVKCPKVNELKQVIRKKYTSKIKDYKYDVIIHSTETDSQIKEVEDLIVKYSKVDTNPEKLRYFKELKSFQFPSEEYVLLNSAWLPFFNIRKNGDLDLLPTNNLYQKIFSKDVPNFSSGVPGKLENRIRFHGLNSPYMKLGDVNSPEEFIGKYAKNLGGLNFVLPRLYVQYKLDRVQETRHEINKLNFLRRKFLKKRLATKNIRKLFIKFDKDHSDLKAISGFFKYKKHESDSFPKMTNMDWGIDLIDQSNY
ncbi:MAG: hypothetical protein CME70_21575 [Halobacteriovorax sp.]|nr:hypothetical protein [Halobacteriovorax sp.]|tara:strand:+ start:18580 stop:19692 length:1113 start_codon:yes stop_codon:yes gene_type:complete